MSTIKEKNCTIPTKQGRWWPECQKEKPRTTQYQENNKWEDIISHLQGDFLWETLFFPFLSHSSVVETSLCWNPELFNRSGRIPCERNYICFIARPPWCTLTCRNENKYAWQGFFVGFFSSKDAKTLEIPRNAANAHAGVPRHLYQTQKDIIQLCTLNHLW